MMRQPYGAYDDKSLKNLGELGYNNAIYWNLDSGDSVGASVSQSKKTYKNYIGGAGSSSKTIALNHETYKVRSSCYSSATRDLIAAQTTIDEVIPYAVNLIKAKKLKVRPIILL